MKNIVYFWVKQYKQLDEVNGKPVWLFDDFGVTLSSKYIIKHSWNADDGIFTIETVTKCPNANNLFDGKYYSSSIHDLKVIVGNNGAGKTSLINLLADIASGFDSHGSLTYVVVWEDNGLKAYLHNGSIYVLDENKKTILKEDSVSFDIRAKGIDIQNNPIKECVVHYSPTYSHYWTDMSSIGEKDAVYDLTTNFLLRNDVESFNNGVGVVKDSLVAYRLVEESKVIDFVMDFFDVQNDRGQFFLEDVLSIPPIALFFISVENVKNGINELAEILSDEQNNQKEIVKEWNVFFANLYEYEDQLKFAMIINAVRIWKSLLLDNKKIEKEKFSIEKVRRLDAFLKEIHNYLNIPQLKKYYENVEKLFELTKEYAMVSWYSLNLQFLRIPLKNNKERIQNIKDIIEKLSGISPFITMQWGRPMSSGEDAYLNFYARLYYCMKKHRNNIFEGILLLDEVEQNLHPEWQRLWFSRFNDGLKMLSEKLDVQMSLHLIMTTHSPFMLTDFSSENILTMERKRDGKYWGKTLPGMLTSKMLAGSIYDILGSGFFLESSIGCLVEGKISEIADKIRKHDCSVEDDNFIEKIGDPVMKSILKNRRKNGQI